MLRKASVLPIVLLLGLSLSAGTDDPPVREAGPLDGFLCCNGFVPFLFHHDEVLTATGRAGIFRFDRNTGTWQRSMQGLVGPHGVSPQVGFVCQARSEPRTVYALAGLEADVSQFNGLFSSSDFGRTWTRRGSVRTGFGFAMCSVDAEDPQTVYVSGIDGSHPWKSTDGGQTVTMIGGSIPALLGAGILTVPGIIYARTFDIAAFETRILASTDRGASFHPLEFPLGHISGFAAEANAIYVSTVDPATFLVTGVFRSLDGGTSFTPVSGLDNGFFELGFDPTDRSRVYANKGSLYVSTDGGLTFTPRANDPRFGPRGIGTIGVDARGSVYVDTFAGPFRTDDGGGTFQSVIEGFRASAVNDLAFDAAGRLLVGVNNTQVVFRQAHGGSFRALASSLIADGSTRTAASVAVSPSDPDVIVVATAGWGISRTDDGGRSWTSAAVDGTVQFHNSRMTFATATRVYLAGPTPSAPGLYRSDDEGGSFRRLSTLPFGALAVDPIDTDTIYVGTYGSDEGLFKSTDGGRKLRKLRQAGYFSALAVDRQDPRVVYAGERRGGVLRSLDGGLTFAPANAGLAGTGVHGFAQDAEGTLFVWLRGGGLFASHDSASSWEAVETGEALRRSGVEAGRGTLVADPSEPGRVYLGNAGVIEIRRPGAR